MCRVVGYLGGPLPLEHVLYETDNSLVAQVYGARLAGTFLSLAGFGMAAWDAVSPRPDEPLVYKSTTLPIFDRNLRNLSRKLEPTCLVAHARAVTYGADQVVAEQNLHPFRFRNAGVTLAHNGHLRDFARMRRDLAEHVQPELASRVEGTTDSEWLYALLLSQLADPAGVPDAEELVEALIATLRIVREVRARHGIETSSPVNVFVSTGQCLVATRFSFDYGWYPPGDDPLLETDLPFVSLWYTLGGRYAQRNGEWTMAGEGETESFIVASEPLTRDASTWLEVPEYAMLSASRRNGTVEIECRDLDV